MGSLECLAAGCLLASFPGTEAPRWVLDLLGDDDGGGGGDVAGGLAGVVLFAGNVGSISSLTELTGRLRAVRPSALVAIDEEGGDVTRLEAAVGSSFPGNAALGAVDDVSLTFEVAAAIGALLASVGIDLDLAPCVDVNSDPRNPVIGVRSFGADPHLVGHHSAAFVRGLQSAGVAACAKHFPGHGHTSVDSHLALPVVDADLDALRARELVPFVAAIEADVAAIMTAHLVLPSLDAAVPATLSHAVLTGLLRDSLDFRGAIVTDALDMAGVSAARGIPQAAVEALAAGADLCCLGPVPDEDAVAAVIGAIAAAVRSGKLSEDRLHEAATRVAAIRRAPGPSDQRLPGRAASGPHPRAVTGRSASLGGVDRPETDGGRTGDGLSVVSGRSGSLGGVDRPESDVASGRDGGSVVSGRSGSLGGVDRPETDVGGTGDGLSVVSGRSGSLGGVDRPEMDVASGGDRGSVDSGRFASLGDVDRPETGSGGAGRTAVGSGSGDAVGLDAARRALRLVRPVPVPLVGAHVVELVAAPGIAVGAVPWGLAGPMRGLDPSVTSERVGPSDRPSKLPPAERPLVIVARDGNRHGWQRDLIGQLVAERPDAVVVEMGWPDPDPDTATSPHLCTYGASRVSAEAAAQLLLGKASRHG